MNENNLASPKSVSLAMEQSTVTVSFLICFLILFLFLIESVSVSSQSTALGGMQIYSQFLK